MVKVAPSVLSANFAELKSEIQSIEKNGADWIHYDVMDGHFVPNISFGYSILKNLSDITDLYLDVHLMISSPMDYVNQFIDSGANLITFHYEAFNDVESIHELISHIHSKGVQVGISIKPNTTVESIKPFLDEIDLVLVMSVEPGFGGQSFQESAIEKISQLNEMKIKKHFLIEVDGGINKTTGQLCKNAGADVLVAGSYVFNAEDRNKAIESLK